MTNNDSSSVAALTAVLTEARAQVCKSCGARAAVRVTPRPVGAHGSLSTMTPVWFCFECGHEEAAID